jgi:GNAT superfamily N-acetyltransferase
MDEPIHIRPFHDEDLTRVLDVMARALGEPPGLGRTPELFAWKHIHNPFGRSIMFVAESGSRVVGFRAFMRWRLTLPGGDELSCVRAVDTATDPAFHRRGIFRDLTMRGLDAASEDGVDLVFNTPNEASRPGYLKMGWTVVGSIGVMIRPRLGILRKRRSDEYAWQPPDGGNPTQAIARGALRGLRTTPAGLRTPRTQEYLRWRYASHPTARYAIIGDETGAVVLRYNTRNGRQEAVVSELAGSAAAAVVRSAARTAPCDYLVGWFGQNGPERRQAMLGGLVPVPRAVALTLVARPLRTLPIDVGSLRSWDLSLGDLELL